MFKKLKRKFILTNLVTSTLVLLIAFASIYLVAASNNNHRAEHPQDFNTEIFIEKKPEDTDSANRSLETPPAETGNTSSEQAPENTEQISPEVSQQIKNQINEQLNTEREESLRILLISLIVSGVVVEIIIALISIYLAEQSIKPVRDAYNAQKDFVANASHEIKTPLAIIQANIEAADIKGNQWIDNAAKKAEDLANLNNQLLALARSESIKTESSTTDTSPNRLVNDVISAFTPKAKEQKIALTRDSKIKDSDIYRLDQGALEQILNIYVDNAIKYGKKRVIIRVKRDRIEVLSDGQPLEKTELHKIFGRFYQTDKSASGVGLGLSIARSIAENNKWSVYASVDPKTKMNVFTIEFRK